MKMQLSPASGNILPPNNSGQITLQLKIANQAYGQVAISSFYLFIFDTQLT